MNDIERKNLPTLHRADMTPYGFDNISENLPMYRFVNRLSSRQISTGAPWPSIALSVFLRGKYGVRDATWNNERYTIEVYWRRGVSCGGISTYARYTPTQPAYPNPSRVWPHCSIGDLLMTSYPHVDNTDNAKYAQPVRIAMREGEIGFPACGADGKIYLVRPAEMFLVAAIEARFVWGGGPCNDEWRGPTVNNAQWNNEYCYFVTSFSDLDTIDERISGYFGRDWVRGWTEFDECGGAITVYWRYVLWPSVVWQKDGYVKSVPILCTSDGKEGKLPYVFLIGGDGENPQPIKYGEIPLPYDGQHPPDDDLRVCVKVGVSIWYSLGYGYYIGPVVCSLAYLRRDENLQLSYCYACENENGKQLMWAKWAYTFYTDYLSVSQYENFMNDPGSFCADMQPEIYPPLPDPDECYNIGPCW